MQLRCTYCQTMFAISREEMLAALEHMDENNLIYYEAHCPKCRRGNRVERVRMERFFPDWRNAIKTMAKEAPMVEPKPGISSAARESLETGMPKAAKVVKRHTPKPAMKPAMKPARPPINKTSFKGKIAPKAATKPARPPVNITPGKGKAASKVEEKRTPKAALKPARPPINVTPGKGKPASKPAPKAAAKTATRKGKLATKPAPKPAVKKPALKAKKRITGKKKK